MTAPTSDEQVEAMARAIRDGIHRHSNVLYWAFERGHNYDDAINIDIARAAIAALASTPPREEVEQVEAVARAIYLAYCDGARATGSRYELVEERHKEAVWRPKARAAFTQSEATTPASSDVGEGRLTAIARAFIDKHHVSCPEATAEDGVYEEAPLLVEALAEVVGYYQYEDDDSLSNKGEG